MNTLKEYIQSRIEAEYATIRSATERLGAFEDILSALKVREGQDV